MEHRARPIDRTTALSTAVPAELVQAFEDYQAGRLGTIPAKRTEVPQEPRTAVTTSSEPASSRRTRPRTAPIRRIAGAPLLFH
jgi:hypothetical protein